MQLVKTLPCGFWQWFHNRASKLF